MPAKMLRFINSAWAAMLLLLATNVHAEDWIRRSFDVAGTDDGILTLEYPVTWGKKPEYHTFDNVTDLTFGPFGPKSKPVFLLQLQAVLAVDPIDAEELAAITKTEVLNFTDVAFETEILVKELQGPNNLIQYFSITDKVKRWGEFDYVTLAVVASGNLLTKCYFFSSDGAADFGADAIRMLESISYTAPAAEKAGNQL